MAQKAKYGATHAAAMTRLGLHELRSAVTFGGNVVQPTEAGIFGTTTPSEVAAERKGEEQDATPERTPSEIVAEARKAGLEESGVSYSQDAGKEAAQDTPQRTPSEIAELRPSYVPEMQQSNDLGHGL